LFERPLEVVGSVDVVHVSRGLQVRVAVQHLSTSMDVCCRFGNLMIVKASVLGNVVTCFLSECRADSLSLELSNEGSVWISAGRFRCNASVSVVSVHPLEVSVGQASFITLVDENMLQFDGSLFVEIMQQSFLCTRSHPTAAAVGEGAKRLKKPRNSAHVAAEFGSFLSAGEQCACSQHSWRQECQFVI
jgi:hypothetical protein